MNKIIKQKIKSVRRSNLFWRYGSNFRPTLDYRLATEKKLRTVEKTVLADLASDGIAFTTVEGLFESRSEIQGLESVVQKLLSSRQTEIESLKAEADDLQIGNKTFNLELLGSVLDFDARSEFAQIALAAPLIAIANGYFGMIAKLRYYNVWKTFASEGAARESQLWHFDREDNYILKVFIYLDDVDEGAGPFTYAPGTHKKGKYRSIQPEYFMEGGVRRTTDEQMNAVYSKDKWVRATGKKGTVIFADTRGFHKGGEARTKDRLMFTCMFTSPASESKRLIVFPKDFDPSQLTKQQRQALQYK